MCIRDSLWILGYGFIYLPWFIYLEKTITKHYHVMHSVVDDYIPFNEYFVIPYFLWFAYVAVTIAYFFFVNKEDYYRLCIFLFTGMTISLLVCTLFPNGTDFRPVIDPNKDVYKRQRQLRSCPSLLQNCVCGLRFNMYID